MNNNFVKLLSERFKQNMHRHNDVKWEKIESILKKNETLIFKLEQMENEGGEIDVIQCLDKLYYVDFVAEAPKSRRSFCYDKEARINRKNFPPSNSAIEWCRKNGVELVDENLYRQMQKVEDLDLKTSVWLKTPNEIREKGGAIFGDKRYGATFIYHNGADSYYSSRGFRTCLLIEKEDRNV
ncbi:DUF4256 domain-containing protein [Mycoplasmopsis iners]|uniref:DUF4256 domain-containing protein n=1 Tax=Mycoplasmopsis iners TaxID=76630 RepID=UPI000497DF1F|nr:DUF4256 domain-containing protein [Mycoplasmopsis iners]